MVVRLFPRGSDHLYHLFVAPLGDLGPSQAGRCGGLQVIGNRRLTDGTTGSYLTLGQPQGMKSENLFDLAHGQPFLRQLGSSTFQWRPACRWFAQRASGLRRFNKMIPTMPISIPGVAEK